MYCLRDGLETHHFNADMHGSIADHPRGENGFGYDSIFIHEGDKRTRGELSTEELERRSPRYEALGQIRQFLNEPK